MPQGSNESADSPLSPVSGAPTEVPTDCGRDDASREGDLAEVPTLVPELHATVPGSLLASGVGEVPSPDLPTSGSWGAEQEALAKKQRLLLDRAYLVDQGFSPLELASLDLDESTAMARQLATELNLPKGDWLVDALYCWLQEAREEAKIYKRAHGYHSGDLAWMSLMPPVELPDAKGVGPAFAAEPPPPLGERNRKLIEDGCIVQAREERLLDIWCRKLRDELLLINAPVLASLQGSLDPDRAGSTRASTLKRYLGYYRQIWAWAKLVKDGLLEKKPASYADAMVATAGLLGILGLPLEVARGADRYDRLDEREIAADLVPWLMERAKLSREQAELTGAHLLLSQLIQTNVVRCRGHTAARTAVGADILALAADLRSADNDSSPAPPSIDAAKDMQSIVSPEHHVAPPATLQNNHVGSQENTEAAHPNIEPSAWTPDPESFPTPCRVAQLLSHPRTPTELATAGGTAK
eukprot:s2381_g3.t1